MNGDRKIVKTDHADVVGNPESFLTANFDRTGGNQIVAVAPAARKFGTWYLAESAT